MGTRRESVRLDLSGNFTPQMMKAAAATELLQQRLNSLSRSSVESSRTTAVINKEVDRTAVVAKKADSSINQLTGRLRLLAEVGTMLGPGLVPMGAVGVAGVAGLANQIGVTALAAGTLVVAFQGVGDALKTVNEAALDPTNENLAKAEEAMDKLAPAAQGFVRQIQAMRPELARLRVETQQGLFPGISDSLRALETRLPDVERIFVATAETAGKLARDAGRGLAGGEWDQFFDFLATDAQDSLADLGATVGNLTRGLAELWMAFDPLNDDFSSWARRASEDFASWADGLSQTQGFADFVTYVRDNGEQVASTLTAFGDALLQIAEAASPLGGPVLAALEAVSKAVAAIADSDIGTPLIAGAMALATLNRALAVTDALGKRMAAGGGIAGAMGLAGRGGQASSGIRTLRGDFAALSSSMVAFGNDAERTRQATSRLATIGKTTGVLLGVGAAATGAADGIGLTNAASLALMGTIAGPWGAAVGGGVGLMMDLGASSAQAREQAKALTVQMEALGASFDQSGQVQATIDSLRELTAGELVAKTGKSMLGALNPFDGSINPLGDFKRVASEDADAADALEASLGSLQQARLASMTAAAGEASAIEHLTEMRRRDADAALAAENSELGYQVAKRESAQAARDYAGSLRGVASAEDAKTEKQQNAIGVIFREAGAWQNLDAAAKDMPGRYESARRSLIKTATSMGMSQKAARNLADQILDIPKTAATRAEFEDAVARQKIRGLKAELAGIKSKTIQVHIQQLVTGSGPKPKKGSFRDLIEGPLDGNRADGGSIPKDGLPYADRYLYALAPGEEVISNRRGQADRFRPLLKAINAAADGDTVGPSAGVGKAFQLSFPGLAREYDMTAKSLKGLRRAVSDNERALDKMTDRRDAVASKRSDVMGAVESKFTSQLFGQDANPWLTQGGSPLGILNADISGLRQFAAARKTLEDKGLDGGALDALFQQGSLQDIQAMAGMSKAELAKYEKQFELRERLVGQQARGAGDQVYGAQLSVMEKHLRGMRQDNRKLEKRLAAVERNTKNTGKDVGDRINKTAKTGARNARK